MLLGGHKGAAASVYQPTEETRLTTQSGSYTDAQRSTAATSTNGKSRFFYSGDLGHEDDDDEEFKEGVDDVNCSRTAVLSGGLDASLLIVDKGASSIRGTGEDSNHHFTVDGDSAFDFAIKDSEGSERKLVGVDERSETTSNDGKN